MSNFLSSIICFAQEAAPAAADASANAAAPAPGAGSFLGSMWIFLPLIGIMYFLMIRPQQKRQKEMQEMLRKLKVGDKVMTTAAALGTITKVNEKTVVVALAPKNIEIEFARGAIAEIIPEAKSEAEPAKK